MSFEANPPDFVMRLLGGGGWNIFADGEIGDYDGERFEKFLIDNNVPLGSSVFLNSCGGNLIVGMELGRIIRAHQHITYVGRKGNLKDGRHETRSGECMSAGAIAFLGGEYRYLVEGSRYGVHRFALSSSDPANADKAQQISASVVEYMHSMDVDTGLFSLASDTPSDDILELPIETLVRLNVINNGTKKPKWSIESIDGAVYLKGERETVYGIQKYIIIFPAKGRIVLHIIFDGGENAEDAMAMESDRFVVDGEYIEARQYRISRGNDHGLINAMYLLETEVLDRIMKAKTVGFSLRFSNEAAVFLGFSNLPFEEGAAKLPGLLDVFSRSGHGNG